MSRPVLSSGHYKHHDWESTEYVSEWAEGQDEREANRQEPFHVMAQTIPFDKELPIKILDVGAGYGALTQFLLKYFPNSTAVCQDGSREMIKLGQQRMASYDKRFTYIHCDFSKSGWSQNIVGSFEAVISSIAIHNVRNPNIVRRIYDELFPLVKTGGCFLNFDRLYPPLKDQMNWLKQAGFVDVDCFWKDQGRGLFGGFKRE